MSDNLVVKIKSLEETERFASLVAKRLSGGTVIGLCGDLGAGKTTFVRFLVSALGIKSPVSSPTFVLEHEYVGNKLSISHWDIYRLRESPIEIQSPPERNIVRLVEWIDKDEELKKEADLVLHFLYGDSDSSRKVIISGKLALNIHNDWVDQSA